MQHMARDPKPRLLRLLTDDEFARLPPGHRALYNHLRPQHGLLPMPDPVVDAGPLLTPPPAPKLFGHPSLPARALVSDVGTPEEQELLKQELLASTAAMLAAHDGDPRLLAQRLRQGAASPEELELAAELLEGMIERPSHRPKTLHREIGEYLVGRLLSVWDRLPPGRRWSWGRVRNEIRDNYGISRSRAHEMLNDIRKHKK
jgi:hypothetical protein